MSILHRRSLLLLAALSPIACSVLGPTATPSPDPATPTSAASVTFTLPPAETAAATALATAAAPSGTPRPTSTRVPTPAITATPEGYYVHSGAGFSLVYPPDWQIEEEDSSGVQFSNSRTGLFFSAIRETRSQPIDVEAEIVAVMDTIRDEFGNVTRGDDLERALAGGLVAHGAALEAPAGGGQTLGIQVLFAVQGQRLYSFLAFARPQALAEQAGAITDVLASVRLFNQVYGLDRSQTLVLLGADPDAKDLDPALSTGSAAGYVGHLFSGLVRLSPELQIEPDLAETWTVSPAGHTYTFTLRAGLTFQSGDPLTAQDVKYSWERAADPATASPTAGTYLGDIRGVTARLAGQADEIVGVRVVDERTLVVELEAPVAYFLAKLTYPTGFVVDEANVSAGGADWSLKPDASGPFALKEYRERDAIVFERNPAYHTPAGTSYVVYQFVPGGSPISLYEAGEIDIVGLGADDVAHIRQPDDLLHDQWLSATSLCTTLLNLDASQPPLDDPLVRRALALAVDRDALIERLGHSLDLPAASILPPAMPGFSLEGLGGYAFDPEAARAALAQSRYAGGLPPIVVNEAGFGGGPSDLITAIAEMWRSTLGAELRIESLDAVHYTEAARAQHGHVVSYGWCADYPDPSNFLDLLYHTASDFNVASYSNAEVDALLEEARSATDVSRRLNLYHSAERLILADAGAIPIMHAVSDILVKPYVKGYVLSPLGAPIIHRLTLDR